MTAEPLAPSAGDVVARLGLAPHPEGGFYRETFRDERRGQSGRAHSTAIYFLLPAGVVSRWHRVDAAEVWHWYGGAPLDLSIKTVSDVVRYRLGMDLMRGERPQAVVPPGAWQQAESLGTWTLVGCTVAPAFLFEHFEIADARIADEE
jgi:uncharacterized protein